MVHAISSRRETLTALSCTAQGGTALAMYCILKCILEVSTSHKMSQRHKKQRANVEKSKVPLCRKTECLLFLSTARVGVMATELLQYFMCRSNASP